MTKYDYTSAQHLADSCDLEDEFEMKVRKELLRLIAENTELHRNLKHIKSTIDSSTFLELT